LERFSAVPTASLILSVILDIFFYNTVVLLSR
jgi:hypothetical protein